MTHGNSRPTGFEQFVNKLVGGLVKLGAVPKHMRSLSVRGRKSGKSYSAPVNLLELDGTRYLLAPRGTTQWVRNLRAAGLDASTPLDKLLARAGDHPVFELS
jgi:hypothetical protein